MQVTQLKVPRFVLKAASESKPPDHATYARAINCAVHPTYTLYPAPLTLNRPRREAQASECRVEVAGIRLQAAACRLQGAAFRRQGTGFRVQGTGPRPRANPLTTPPTRARSTARCLHPSPNTLHPNRFVVSVQCFSFRALTHVKNTCDPPLPASGQG